MHRVLILVSLVATLVGVVAVQVPLDSAHPASWQGKHLGALNSDDHTKWSLDKIPNPNATDHLVFDTVYSLLQHWSSIRIKNGHNIVPGKVPKGTLLYHARRDNKMPAVPEWVAMDPEHSYWSCGGVIASSCWLLTLTTTRPLKVVYFDGLSSTKTPNGVMDTQDLLAWGALHPERSREERPRINALCEWGKNFGVDGFVRTEMDFEIMLCDFTSGVSIVSFMNIVNLHGMPTDTTLRVTFETWHAGSWHNHFPGETRFQLDLSGLVSFYDTQLAPSLIAARAGQKRAAHRVGGVSKEDLSAAVSRLEAALTRPSDLSSGIDWRTLIQVIVDRYAGRLERIRHLLSSPTTGSVEVLDLANKTQMQLRVMLTPYLTVSVTPMDSPDETALEWAAPVYEQCAMTHTSRMESQVDAMTESEKLLLQAVRGTSREICRVVTRMWVAGVYAGIDSSINQKASPDVAEVTQTWNSWREDLNRLMEWLDWSVWTKCEPSCGPEEICALFSWPNEPPRFPIPTKETLAEQIQNIDFIDLQPKCISVIDLEVKV